MPDGPRALTLSLELRSGLAAEEVERRALAGHRAGDLGARVCAFYLADMADRNLHQRRGFASLAQYAKQRMRMAPSTLKESIRVGRALRELPEIDRLFAEDELCWTQVRMLTRVVARETERAWGEWAVGKTIREVELQTRRHEKGDLPTDPDRRRIHTTRLAVQARLNPVEDAVWGLWRKALEDRVFGEAVSDRDLLMWMAHKGVRELTGEPLTIRPASLDLDPRNHGSEIPYEERDAPTSKAMREQVLERDGNVCVCCGSKRNLSAHHMHMRRYGGRTVLANLITLCEDCHSLVHDRFLILRGDVEELAFLDSAGHELGKRTAPLKYVLEANDAGATRGDPADPSKATRGATVRVSFEDVPRAVDSDWWRRNRHLFSYSKRAGGLTFEPGVAPTVDPPTTVSAEALEAGPGLDSLIGQERVRESLRVSIRSAAQAVEQLGHVLLLGAPGLGKTSLARAIASELDGEFHSVMAPVIRDPALLVRQLTSLRPGSVLFLDEVHRLPPRVAEVLYGAMEGGQIDLPLQLGPEQRTLRIHLAPFTLVAATTEEGLLPQPLRSRFVYQERLEFYERPVLEGILERAVTKKGLEISTQALRLIAGASRDTPREGLALAQRVCDEARAASRVRVDADVVRAALARSGTALSGVTAAETECLRVLDRSRGPMGLSALAARLGTSPRNVQRFFEPFLLRRGLMRLTPRGRCLTREGRLALAGGLALAA